MAAGDTDDELPTRLSPGETVAGRYRVDHLIGRGGMGEIYRAEHLLTGQDVALKLVRRSNEEAQRRLLREAKAASRLKSPHTARVLDADTLASGDPFLVFELLDGQDLASVLRARGRLSAKDAVAAIAQAASALGEAHALGIVHRDVKPSNLFMVESPGPVEIKVLDFGIAKVDTASDTSVTITGSVMGSPRYMSPEQIRDPKRTDARTDIWSLGVTLHELLTGYAPFEESYAPALCAMITSEQPHLRLAPTDSESAALLSIIERCLEKDRKKRFASAAELEEALRAVVIGDERTLSLRPASASTSNSDTLEPQDTSSRAGLRASTPAPTRDRSRRSIALAISALAAVLAVAWWAKQPAPSAEPVAAALVSATVPLPMTTAPEQATSPVKSPEVDLPAEQPSSPTASASAAPKRGAPLPRLSAWASSSVVPPESAPPPLDEAAVLKDRR